MNTPGARVVARVVVALDPHSPGDEAVPLTVALAMRIGAELEAVFVEDIDLLRAAGLPSAAELSLHGGTYRPIDRREVEGQLEALSAAAREAIATEARAHRLTWRFRVARGRVVEEILAVTQQTDLIVVRRAASPPSLGRPDTRAARALAQRARGSVLLLGRSGGAARAPAVVYDGSPAARRGLELAAHVAHGARLTIFLTAPTAEQANRLAERARASLPQGTHAAMRWIGSARISNVVRATPPGEGLVVVGAESPVLEGNGLEALLDAVDSALLLAR